MIICFTGQKGGVGKSTLAIAFANYLVQEKGIDVKMYDFDSQQTIYQRWNIDNEHVPGDKLYEVNYIERDNNIFDVEFFDEHYESDEVIIVDLAGTQDMIYTDLLQQSNFLILPFEYTEFSMKSTLVFLYVLGQIESMSEKIFIANRYDKGYNYPGEEFFNGQIKEHNGTLVNSKILKRNELQKITTKSLNYAQKKAVKDAFEEMIILMDIKVPKN
ncbi:CO dehydrogenase maturation factor [Candidatus Ornithobacterium hominis]|uniref:CO dehydrogenase maturation factor n=1 Tax=Candidatus Ornithobacterium hominis TaxID=2497989 RepID=A0A383U3T3_9FLAO|nr:ParA family protein [Candidatus Ornithobacterium hominis]MCT7905136.1 ParA family protein [Candidatus Ornithobacterium hominis]SZD74200.1 CO dehydrogenase maturation factor [Candidatus Ornithobacterium hominis]